MEGCVPVSPKIAEMRGCKLLGKSRKVVPDLLTLDQRTFTIRSSTSELYNDAGGDPTLFVLGLVAELSHEPVCLHQS